MNHAEAMNTETRMSESVVLAILDFSAGSVNAPVEIATTVPVTTTRTESERAALRTRASLCSHFGVLGETAPTVPTVYIADQNAVIWAVPSS